MPPDEYLYVDLAQSAIRLTRQDRHAFADLAPADRSRTSWRIKTETLRWWKSPEGLTPITDVERRTILKRMLQLARDQHKLYLGVTPGPYSDLADEPRAAPDHLLAPEPEPMDELAFMNAGASGEPVSAAPPAGRNLTPVESEALIAELNARDLAAAGEPSGPSLDDAALLGQIDLALRSLEPAAAQGWDVATSIVRQLKWCRGTLLSAAVEPPPGPLSMGLIATREFDMWGSEPELARLINTIQREMERRPGTPR